MTRMTSMASVARPAGKPMLTWDGQTDNLSWSVAAQCIALNGQMVHSTRWNLRSRFLATPPALNAPVRGAQSEYCHAVWRRTSRMVWLHDGENILKIYLYISTTSTNVTDRPAMLVLGLGP